MPACHTHLVQRLLRLAGAPDPTSDEELLGRFVRARDEAAFAALVARHGPMVLRLCRRVLGQGAAEDAFQATFLVLARRAGSVRRPAALAAWLHGVAYRLALKARLAGDRRREAPLADLAPADPRPGPLDELTGRELLAILDEEIQRLPEAHRLAVLLCCLEGRSLEEAAGQLGWSVGALRGRLQRGRDRLRGRLARRGLALPAALLPATLAPAAVPAALLTAACRAPLAEGLSARAVALAEGALKGGAAVHLKAAATLLLALAVVTAGALARPARPAKAPPVGPTAPDKAPPAAPLERPVAAGPAAQPAGTDRYGDPLPPGALARLGTVRWRPGDHAVSALTFTADGKALLSGGRGIVLWEAATGKPLRRFGGELAALALSPDGQKVASGGALPGERAIRLWDLKTGKELRRFADHPTFPYASLAFSPDGKALASGGSTGPQLWDVASGKRLRQFAGAGGDVLGNCHYVAFSPDGRALAAALTDGSVRLWEVPTGKELRRFDNRRLPYPVAFSPRGDRLAWVGTNGSLFLTGLAPGDKVRKLREAIGHAHCLTFSLDGKRLALTLDGFDGVTFLYDVATGKELRRFEEHRHVVWSTAFSPDGSTLAVGGSGGRLRLWDVRTGRERVPDRGHPGLVGAVAFGPDGQGLVTAGPYDGTVRRWDATGKELGRLECFRGGAGPLTVSPDGKLASAVADDNTIRAWEVASGKRLRDLPGSGPVRALALSADGKSLAAAGWPGALEVWDLSTGRRLRSWRAPADQTASSLAFAPDGELLASGNDRGAIVLREVATGKERTLPGATGAAVFLAFSPDGRSLASGSYQAPVRLWDVATGQELRRLTPLPREGAWCVAFSLDGRLLAAGGADRAVRLWEVATGAEVGRFVGHPEWPAALAFSPDGRSLTSGAGDGTALVWDLSFPFRPRPATALSAKEAEALWVDLAGADDAQAQRAVWALAGAPPRAVALLGPRLRPIPRARPEAIRRLVADLDSDAFATREAASRALEKLGTEAEPALRAALAARPSLEVVRRIDKLLALLRRNNGRPDPEALRQDRAVQALELAPAPEAVRLLQRLAKGPPDARLTQQAAAAVQRLARRAAGP
jgi:RNA polymerase sigma factor (sigma-70 family)